MTEKQRKRLFSCSEDCPRVEFFMPEQPDRTEIDELIEQLCAKNDGAPRLDPDLIKRINKECRVIRLTIHAIERH